MIMGTLLRKMEQIEEKVVDKLTDIERGLK